VLPSPYDVTVKGVAFTPNLRVYYDVPRLGLYNVSLLSLDGDQARANERGTFIGYIPLSTIARAPGVYVIRLHQAPDNGTVSVEIVVSVGAPPPLGVEVRVASVRYADERVGVWIAALYGGSLATPNQIVRVEVLAILRWSGGFKEVLLNATRVSWDRAVFLAEFTPITLFGREALGGEIFVIVTVTGRYAPDLQLDRVTSTAVISIPPITLSDVVRSIEMQSTLLPEILEYARRASEGSSTIIAMLTEQGALVLDSLTRLESLLSGALADLTVVKLSLASISSNLSRLATLTVRLEGGVNRSLALLEVVRELLSHVDNVVVSVKGDVVYIRSTDIPGVLRALESVNRTLAGVIRVELSNLRSDLAGSLKSISDALASTTLATISRLDAIQSSLARLSEATLATRGSLDTLLTQDVPAIRASIETLSRSVTALEGKVVTLDVKVDEVRGKVGNLSEKRDIESLRRALVEEVRGARDTLSDLVREARDVASSTARNWVAANIVLTILALALLAYTAITVRRLK